MPLKFQSYEKIVERPERYNFDEKGFRLFRQTKWVVTEKIHGANFAIVCDGNAARFAKRKVFLEEGEDFFGHTALLPLLTERVCSLTRAIRKKYTTATQITVFGEIFGGSYPHPDVAPNVFVQPVQTGVYYSPDIHFCAFDIVVEPVNTKQQRRHLDYEEAQQYSKEVGLMYTSALATVKYEEALQYPLGFQSHIPKLLNLPVLSDNRAEGIVIKPAVTFYVSTNDGWIRPVIKRKIAEFAEDERFHQAQKWSAVRPSLLGERARMLVNPPRISAAISKIGRVTLEQEDRVQEVVDMVVLEVMDELGEAYPKEYSVLNQGELLQLQEQISGMVMEVVRVVVGGG